MMNKQTACILWYAPRKL